MQPSSLVWQAPSLSHSLNARVSVPGSKSETARALFLAAISRERTLIHGALVSRDTDLMLGALTALGASFEYLGDGRLVITPIPDSVFAQPSTQEITVNVGLAGTVMRFVPLLAALRPGVTHFLGDVEASARPMGSLLDLIRSLGAQVTCHDAPESLPFSVRGVDPSVPFGSRLEVDASRSSQFVSAALLCAPMFVARDGQPREIVARGTVVSLPHIEMTCAALEARGVDVDVRTEDRSFSWKISNSRVRGGEVFVSPDLTNAGVFLAAAMLVGGRVRIPAWPRATTQAGQEWIRFFSTLGAVFTWDEDTLVMQAGSDPEILPSGVSFDEEAAQVCCTVPALSSSPHSVPSDRPHSTRRRSSDLDSQGFTSSTVDGRTPHLFPRFEGVDWDFSRMGELVPTAVAVLLFADSPSVIRGVAHIRGHETDRLAALTHEIRAMGGQVIEYEDGLRIIPMPLRAPEDGNPLRAYADHRMATFAALVGLRVPGLCVDDIACTSKTLPDFPALWDRLVNDSLPGKD